MRQRMMVGPCVCGQNGVNSERREDGSASEVPALPASKPGLDAQAQYKKPSIVAHT